MKYIGFPSPSYPLVATLERTYVVSCKCESKKEKSVGFGSTMAIADIWTTQDLESSRNP